MRIISLSLHGCKVGTAPTNPNKTPPLRGVVQGWSTSSSRRNVDFLRSVEYSNLSGIGICFTGTLLHCPASSDDWHKLRDTFIKRLARASLIRSHWVTEWQRRGVPHLHGMFFFPDSMCSVKARTLLIDHWLALTCTYGSLRSSQYATMMHDGLGWAQYSAKHAARGVGHYQRSPENIPHEWKSKTGRVWGKTGSWPVRDSMKFEVSDDVYYRFRRMAKGWRLADARSSGCRFRIRSARKCLKSNDRNLSNVRGVSEWLPLDASTAFLFSAVALSQSPKPIEQVD